MASRVEAGPGGHDGSVENHADPSVSGLYRFISSAPLYASILFVGTLLAFSYIFDEDPDLNGDNTNYHMLGKALSEGRGYTNTGFLVPVPATNFPPGYPVLIAAVMTAFSDEIVTIEVANGVFLAIAILLLFYLFSCLSDNRHLAFVASVATALNGHLLHYSTIMMSEIPFLLFTTATVVLFLRVRSGTFADRLRDPFFYLFLFCLVFSYYIRTAGLALLAGVLSAMLLRREWKSTLLVGGVFLMCALPWSLRAKALGAGSYMTQLALINPYQPELGTIGFVELISRIIGNAARYLIKEIPTGCLSFLEVDYGSLDSTDPMTYVPGIALLLLMTYGAFTIRHHRDLIVSYLLASAAILLSWPEAWSGVRFVIPVIPLLLFCLLNGLWTMLRLVGRRMLRLRPHPLYLLPLVLPLANELPDLHARAASQYPAGWQNYIEMARWARLNLPEDAVVCCRKSSLFHLYADRYVTRYEFIDDHDEFVEDLRRKQVTHVVVDEMGFSSTTRYLTPAILKHKELFTLQHMVRDPNTLLLEFHPERGP